MFILFFIFFKRHLNTSFGGAGVVVSIQDLARKLASSEDSNVQEVVVVVVVVVQVTRASPTCRWGASASQRRRQ